MHKLLFSILLSVFSMYCVAQTSQTVHYYKDQYLNKEVAKEKASFSKTITHTADTITTEVKNIKTNKIIRSESYKGDEPVGIWISGETKLDYNFTIVYSDDLCPINFPGIVIQDFFHDDDSIGYIAPKMQDGQALIYRFIMNQVRYPESAKLKKLQGMSTISFIINTEGRVENITARKGSNIAFDKEAIRVIKLLSFSSPAQLNGKPQRLCVMQKIKFNLDY